MNVVIDLVIKTIMFFFSKKRAPPKNQIRNQGWSQTWSQGYRIQSEKVLDPWVETKSLKFMIIDSNFLSIFFEQK
jgi:hypothetical protein